MAWQSLRLLGFWGSLQSQGLGGGCLNCVSQVRAVPLGNRQSCGMEISMLIRDCKQGWGQKEVRKEFLTHFLLVKFRSKEENTSHDQAVYSCHTWLIECSKINHSCNPSYQIGKKSHAIKAENTPEKILHLLLLFLQLLTNGNRGDFPHLTRDIYRY